MAKTCTIDGCGKPPRSRTAEWCEMHYGRWRRNGHPERLHRWPERRKTDRGYVLIGRSTHPLANAQGWVYEHRVVLYDQHQGRCPTGCEWCGEPFGSWADVHADHLNYDRGDNRPENLRCACRSCNIGRHEGSDLESWAASMAARRILRRYRQEYLAEINRLSLELQDVPSGRATDKTRAANRLRAVQAVATEQAGGWNA